MDPPRPASPTSSGWGPSGIPASSLPIIGEDDRLSALQVLLLLEASVLLPQSKISLRRSPAVPLLGVPSPFSACQASGARVFDDPEVVKATAPPPSFTPGPGERCHSPARVPSSGFANPLDVLLHPKPCGLISSRLRSRGSSEGFEAGPILRSTPTRDAPISRHLSTRRFRDVRTFRTSSPRLSPHPRRLVSSAGGYPPAVSTRLLSCASSKPGARLHKPHTPTLCASESRSWKDRFLSASFEGRDTGLPEVLSSPRRSRI